MTNDLRERVEAVVDSDVDDETMQLFTGEQVWYRYRGTVITDVVRDGSVVVTAGSCDMVDLLGVCEERGWSIQQEAAETVRVVDDYDD